MTYSWLDILVSDPGPPPVIDLGVRTHLARSDDGGATFAYVRSLNETVPIQHPDTQEDGWTIHEVSAIARRGPGDWEALWLTYFEPFGEPAGPEDRSGFYFRKSEGSSADALGESSQPWIQGYGTSTSFGALHDLSSEISELSDCMTFTEPALFVYDDHTYLAMNCVIFDASGRRDDLERLELLRESGDSYEYLGRLLEYADALDLGGTRLEQAELAIAENGAILLIVTPIDNQSPQHHGCVALEVTDIDSASVRRDTAGDVVVLAEITGEDDSIGPGLCTYHAASDTGVMIVLHDQTTDPFDLEFSLRATGVHPLGLDTDADGRADTVDNCPSTPNAGQSDADGDSLGDACDAGDSDGDQVADQTEFTCGSVASDPGSTPERVDVAGDEDGDSLTNEPLAAGSDGTDCDGDGYIGSAEQHVFAGLADRDQDRCGINAWPSDLVSGSIPDSTDRITISDLASFVAPIRFLGTNAGSTQGDVRWDLAPGPGVLTADINVLDLSALVAGPTGFPPMLGGARAFSGPLCPP